MDQAPDELRETLPLVSLHQLTRRIKDRRDHGVSLEPWTVIDCAAGVHYLNGRDEFKVLAERDNDFCGENLDSLLFDERDSGQPRYLLTIRRKGIPNSEGSRVIDDPEIRRMLLKRLNRPRGTVRLNPRTDALQILPYPICLLTTIGRLPRTKNNDV